MHHEKIQLVLHELDSDKNNSAMSVLYAIEEILMDAEIELDEFIQEHKPIGENFKFKRELNKKDLENIKNIEIKMTELLEVICKLKKQS